MFLISYRLIQYKRAINTVTNLADQSFIYTITKINPTAYYNNNLDLFTYIIISQYTFNKFYRVMINTGALKRLIVDYRQYLAYRKIYNAIVDILKASTINV